MAGNLKLGYYGLSSLLEEYGYDYVVQNIINKLNFDSLEESICNLIYFYKGGVTFEWLERQPLTKVLRLQEYAANMNARIKKEINKST